MKMVSGTAFAWDSWLCVRIFAWLTIGKDTSLAVVSLMTVRDLLQESAIFSANGRWTVEGGGGITGSSHFYGSDWKMSKWKRVNGQISVGYYVPEVNTLVKVEGARFIYGDYGYAELFHAISANIL